MRRWLPRVGSVLIGLLLIVVGGAWYLVATFDTVALEAELALAARERTGHDLSLEDLELRLLPMPTLGVSGLSLGPAPGFGPEPLLTVVRARARVRLLPLMRGELELGSLVLEGLALRLERTEAGRGSWETIIEHLRASRDPTATTSLPILGRLVLRDASVLIEDRASGRGLGIQPLQLRLGPLDARAPAQLHVEAAVRSSEPAVDAELTLAGSGRLVEDLLVATTMRIEAVVRGHAVPGGVQQLSLRAPFQLDPHGGRLEVEAFEFAALGVQVEGEVEAHQVDGALGLEGRVAAACPDLRGLLRQLDREPPLLDPTALTAGALATAFRWDGQALRLEELQIGVDDSTASGTLTLAGLRPPTAWFDLRVDALNLDRYAQVLGSGASAAPKGLGGAWLEGQLRVDRLTVDGLLLEDLVLPIGVERGALAVDGASARLLGGSVRAGLQADLGASPPRYRIHGQVSDLDLERLIAASGSARDLSGRLDLDVDLLASGSAREALLGSLDGRLCVALSDGEMPMAEREGTASLRQGEQGWRARRAQDRFAKVRERLVEHATRKLDAQRPERLVYSHMGACFALEAGVARSDDLAVDAEDLQLDGAGHIDLPGESLDISCVLELEGLPGMELRVHGSLDDPQVELDKPGAMDVVRYRLGQRRGARQQQVEQQRSQLQDELQEHRQALRDDLRDKTGDGVDRLLDHRERTLERRDELRQQVQEARQGLRSQLRETRQGRRDGRRAADDADTAEPGEEPGDESSEQGTQTDP